MTTQPTNLPVPSESPRDLKFNAGKIDEFVTSMGWTYTDRFGVQHYTIEGMRWLAQQAIAAFGYITLDSFEDGNTLTLPNQVLRLEATGEYYRWDGPLPKDVPENSTPETSGGIGAGKWLSVGDAALRQQLASDSDSLGDALVTTKQPYTGAKTQTVHSKLAQVINVLDFDGVVGDGVNDDTAGIQAAVNATPWGGKIIFSTPKVSYKVSSEISINKPITILGDGGSTISNRQMPCIKASGHHNIFKLIPTLDGYRFDYGITGVTIQDLMLEGPELNNNGDCGICVDETVNTGIYHVRECNFSGLHIRYFDFGLKLRGVVYLNDFYNVRALWCASGCVIDKVPGSSEGLSDQNRFFGCEFVLCDRGLILSETAHGGSQTIVGCTISENTTVGVIAGFNTTFYMSGSQIESNPIGVNFTIPSSVSNPAAEGSKTIIGNCFLFNGYDIWVAKETTSLTSGFPLALLNKSNFC